MQINRFWRTGLVLLGLGVFLSAAQAQSWPAANKPLTFINPFPPGGAVDAFGRPLARQLSSQLGVPIVVENRGGAGGTIGAAIAARAAPDGYTWLLGAVHHTIAPSMYPKLSYELERDFEPVAILGSVPHVIVVHPGRVPENSVKDLIARIRKNPGRLNYASTGSGTSQHLAGELFKVKNNLFITHIPYRGTGPALQDLIAGQVDMMFDTLAGAGNFIKSGQLKALAVASNKRVPGFDNVPTAAEAGLPDYEVSSWYGLWAIKGTPPEIVAALGTAFQTAINQSADKMNELAGVRPRAGYETSAQVMALVREGVEQYTQILRAAGVQPE